MVLLKINVSHNQPLINRPWKSTVQRVMTQLLFIGLNRVHLFVFLVQQYCSRIVEFSIRMPSSENPGGSQFHDRGMNVFQPTRHSLPEGNKYRSELRIDRIDPRDLNFPMTRRQETKHPIFVNCPGKANCSCSSLSPGLIKMDYTHYKHSPKSTSLDLPAYVGSYTLFDSAVRFVFCNSEIGQY